MRILTFSAYYSPEIAASLYLSEDIFEAFSKNGNKVDLYVPIPTRGVSKEVRKEYSKRKTEQFYDGALTVHRFCLYGETKNTLLRAIRYAFLEVAFFFKGLFTKTDLIFVQSTPPIQGAMAAMLKKFKKVPFIYNLQDIFPDSLVNTGMTSKGSVIWKIGRMFEKFTYKNAQKIVVISEGFKNNIMEKGVPEDKIAVIPNWVDTNEVKYVGQEDNFLFEKYGLDRDKFYVCYSGNIGYTQNMDMLLDVAKDLKEYDNISFIIVGDGAYKPKVEERISNENIDNVRLIPFQPYENISEVFSLGDIGLIISKTGVGSNSVPSKTWSYMSAQRPVLASFDKGSELDKIISENNCGICVEPDNADALKIAVIELYGNREELQISGKNGREYILRNLSKEIGTERWLSILTEWDMKNVKYTIE